MASDLQTDRKLLLTPGTKYGRREVDGRSCQQRRISFGKGFRHRSFLTEQKECKETHIRPR